MSLAGPTIEEISIPTTGSDYPFFNNVSLILAFVVAFYGLIAQWKRVPYIVTSMYRLTVLAIIVIIFEVCLEIFLPMYIKKNYKPIQNNINITITIVILLMVLSILIVDFNKYFRYRSFRIWQVFHALFDMAKSYIKIPNKKRQIKLNPKFAKEIFHQFFLMKKDSDWSFLDQISENKYSISVLCHIEDRNRFNSDLYNLALKFLKNGAFVQYISCDRHPIEFLNGIFSVFSKEYKDQIDEENEKQKQNNIDTVSTEMTIEEETDLENIKKVWSGEIVDRKGRKINFKDNLILIDAHTKHFGFNERIYKYNSKVAKDLCLDIITSDASYPGIHSAIIKGFLKVSKKRQKKNNKNSNQTDEPLSLIIYEDLSSLIDLESHEQYKIFLRHIIASERLESGLFTVFFENYTSVAYTGFLQNIVDKTFLVENQHDIAYTAYEIQQQIPRIVSKISDWIHKENKIGKKVKLLSILNGGEVFCNDIDYHLSKNKRIKYIKTSIQVSTYDSFGNQLYDGESNVQPTDEDFSNCSIIIVDDICHEGKTLKAITEYLKSKKGVSPASILTIVAILKKNGNYLPDDFLFDYSKKYSDFPDAWLYGYGMDVDESLKTKNTQKGYSNLDYGNMHRKLPAFAFLRRHA
ncbi:phosphoribosyltransferase family protein [Arsenicibacter rosenii]|nr:phosphoribosyltransferase family protein [Arsenicibacter rosenii]